MPDIWTRTPPTEPGWYWWRYSEQDALVVVGIVKWASKEMRIHGTNERTHWRGGEFGPRIPSPEWLASNAKDAEFES